MGRNFKNLDIYNLSYKLVLEIYKILNQYPDFEKHNITSQIRRASVSIPLNIAEGCAKSTDKQFFHYLTTASGSSKEVEVLLNLSKDLKYINQKQFNMLFDQLDELNSKLYLFTRQIESKIKDKKHYFYGKFKS